MPTDKTDYLKREWRAGLKIWQAHAVLVTFVVALLFGAFAYEKGHERGLSDAQKLANIWTHSIQHDGLTPPPRVAHIPMTVFTFPTAPRASAFVSLMDHVKNQGSVGACQCFAFAYQYDYLYNLANHTHKHFSCRFWYTVITHGQDTGSFIDQYPPVLLTYGGALDSAWGPGSNDSGWPGPPSFEDKFVPSNISIQAAAHHYGVETHVITVDAPGGQNTINGMEHFIARHNLVNFDMPVFSGPGAHGAFDVTASNPVIDVPVDMTKVTEVGGHATTCYAYDRVAQLFTCRNQWGTSWGMRGDFRVTYRFVARWGFGIEALHLTKIRPQAVRPPVFLQPSPAVHFLVPPPPGVGVSPPTAPKLGAKYVTAIYAHDTGRNLSVILNQQADRTGIPAADLAATMFAECGGYTTSTRCDRYGGGLDVSFACCQETVSTVAQYGVCNFDVQCTRIWEDNPQNGISLEATIMRDYTAYEHRVGCDIGYPSIEVAWNAGPGNPCWFLLNPSGVAGANYYGDFLPWFNIAWKYASYTNPYAAKPAVFPRAAFGTRVSPYYRGRLSMTARFWWNGHTSFGRATSSGFYGGRHGYQQTSFSKRRSILCWPSYGSCKAAR